MKLRFAGIGLSFICLIVLPLALSVVVAAADNNSDVKLSSQLQKIVDEAPPELRGSFHQTLVETQRQLQMHVERLQERNAAKKMMSRMAARLPKWSEMQSGIGGQLLNRFMQDAADQQEFRDYTGIDKELAENINKKKMEIFTKTGDTPRSVLSKITQASTDNEIDKIIDEMIDQSIKTDKEKTAMLKKELNPQQLEKLKELQMINSSKKDNVGLFSRDWLFDFGQYEALNLTGKQQKKIAVIKTEYLSAIEPLFKKATDIQQRIDDAMMFPSEEQDIKDITKRVEEAKKEWEEVAQPITQLNAATRAKILALFTQEQITKLDNVLTNAPKYLAVRIGLIKKGENNGAWKPNDKSWKPGDGVPEETRPEQEKPHKSFPLHE